MNSSSCFWIICSWGIFDHSSWKNSFSSDIFVGCLASMPLHNTRRLRYEFWLGHSKGWICFTCSHSVIELLPRQGSLLCCNTQPILNYTTSWCQAKWRDQFIWFKYSGAEKFVKNAGKWFPKTRNEKQTVIIGLILYNVNHRFPTEYFCPIFPLLHYAAKRWNQQCYKSQHTSAWKGPGRFLKWFAEAPSSFSQAALQEWWSCRQLCLVPGSRNPLFQVCFGRNIRNTKKCLALSC